MIGKTISHYKILEKLGEGGMGIVYKAQDTKLDRIVALKFLPSNVSMNSDEKKRFVYEAKAVAALDHNNICVIYEIDETEDGQIFIAMAYYEGETLKDKIKGTGTFTSILHTVKIRKESSFSSPVNDTLDIFIQAAEGLGKAHEKGIIHRDIKSANIIITDEGIVKILDFGLAKLKGQTQLTQKSTTMGTVNYMSPEQASGKVIDHRSDIWSLGVVMYEMVTGQLPFIAQNSQAVIYSILNKNPESIKKLNPDVPDELVRIIGNALKKKKESRYSSVAEIIKELKKYKDSLQTAKLNLINIRSFLNLVKKPVILIPILIFILLIGYFMNLFFNFRSNVNRAKEVMIPKIESLIESSWRDFTIPYKLAEEAEEYIPDDPELAVLFAKCSLNINIKTNPPGSKIYMKPYKSPENKWKYIGVSPVKNIRVPIGIFRWKFEKEGFETVHAAAATFNIDINKKALFAPKNLIRVLDKRLDILNGMVRIQGAQTFGGKLEDFYIDRYEVTNAQYKKFIESDGYKKKEYWKYEFVEDGKILTWEEAMKNFMDQTERQGPADWMGGDYPEGHENYPVSGISWYEAAAFAEYLGKSLPTQHHWGLARGEAKTLIQFPQLGGFALFAPFSNFGGTGKVAVGSLPGITSFGAFDMAGNVREWCWNKTLEGRLIRGGAWNDNTYMFNDLSQAPPMNRSIKNGLRCAFYSELKKVPESAYASVKLPKIKDYYKEVPVSDSVFGVYKELFQYDTTDPEGIVESRNEDSENWIQEKISFGAAYGGERIIAHLFLPKDTPPPYQTVIYFPGSASIIQATSNNIENYYEFPIFLSFLVKNGRAVLYPVYKGTFERKDLSFTQMFFQKKFNSYLASEFTIQQIKDLKRSIDYLETRKDIDCSKLAYYGMSWGGWLGPIAMTMEDRLKAGILLAGSITAFPVQPKIDPFNYISRVKVPVLMLNGKYDMINPYEQAIKPMIDLIGTSAKHKKMIAYNTDHIAPRNEFIKEILIWLDRYLGPVEEKKK